MARKKTVEEMVEEPIVEDKEQTTFDVFVEHQKHALESAGKALTSLIPDGVKEHGRKAVEEMIEGYRVVFNTVMDDVLDRVHTTKEDVNQLVDKMEGKEKDKKEVETV